MIPDCTAWARHRRTRWSRQLPWHRAYVRHVPVPYLTVVRSAASAILPESYFFNVYFIGRQEGRTVGRARRDRSGQGPRMCPARHAHLLRTPPTQRANLLPVGGGAVRCLGEDRVHCYRRTYAARNCHGELATRHRPAYTRGRDWEDDGLMAKLHCNIACMHYLYNKKRERSRSYGRPFDSKTDKKNDLPSSVNYVTGRCWYAYCHRWATFVFVAHTTDSGNSRHIRVCRVCILLYYIFAGSDTLHIENWYND